MAPHSFTGEDVVEISCHGGVSVKQTILDCLFKLGATAEPGEFSKRAFMNGKMDLTQAEAVMDLIQAEARKAPGRSCSAHGALSKRIRQLSDDVYRLLAQVELILEYPEHEETDESLSTLISGLESLADSMAALKQASVRAGS